MSRVSSIYRRTLGMITETLIMTELSYLYSEANFRVKANFRDHRRLAGAVVTSVTR